MLLPQTAYVVVKEKAPAERRPLGLEQTQRNFIPILLSLQTQADENIGKLVGGTYRRWLLVDMIFVIDVPDAFNAVAQLLQFAEEEAISRGCQSALVEEWNAAQLPKYEAYGYSVVEDLPAYSGRGEPFALTKVLVTNTSGNCGQISSR
jgi:hypothetical protein